jgi:sugar phosphate isomerase/epimerase
MRPLAFSTNAFKKNTLAESIESLASIGYGAVELMADLHHAYPPTFDATRREQTRRLLADRRLTVSNVNAFTHFVDGDTYHPTWIEADAALRQTRVEHTLRCVELAAEFGAATVSIQPGGPMIGRDDLSYDSAAEVFAEALSQVVPAAREYGVVIAVEPEPGLLIQSADEYRQFKQRFFAGEDAVRMNCDVGHLFCVGDDPAAVIRSMPADVAHVHLEDIGANRVHQHLTPGNGVLDFADIFAALRDIRYDGHVTVELYPYETTAAGVAKKAWEHLQRIE